MVKRILWDTRNGGSQLAAAQVLDEWWHSEREARTGTSTHTCALQTHATSTAASTRMASPGTI